MNKLIIFLAFILTLPSLSRGGDAQVTPPRRAETIEIHLQIIPFYVVDQNGAPVFDLKPEEVQIRINGKPYPLGHLDRYPFLTPSEEIEERPIPQSPPSPSIPRHVFIWFDLAFSTIRGYQVSRDVVMRVAQHLLETDRVYLLVFTGKGGLKQLWGPITGRARVLMALRKTLRSAISTNRAPTPDADYPTPIPEASGEIPLQGEEDQFIQDAGDLPETSIDIRAFIQNVDAFSQWTYREIARLLAQSFQALGNVLRTIPGPKLVIFLSQGIRNDVYFSSAYQQVQETHEDWVRSIGQGDRYGTSFLHREFERGLRKLSEAGAMFMVVNTEGYTRYSGARRSGEEALRHMARVTGGVYVEGLEKAVIERQVQQWTAAYYEAGIYLEGRRFKGKFHKVEVRVLRPGVRVWTIRGFREPRPYRNFSSQERLIYAVQVIYQGVDRVTLRPADAQWFQLTGHTGGESVDGQRIAWFDLEVPPDMRGRKVDLFHVLIEADVQGRPGRVRGVRSEKIKLPKSTSVYRTQIRLPTQLNSYIWGVVVVDRKTGLTGWRRFHIRIEPDKP